MNLLRFLPLACLLVAGAATAQSAGECPTLADGSSLSWKKVDGPGFTFCKAIRDSDAAEILAVTISEQSPFEPRRIDRVEKTTIDGHKGYWYRSEIAMAPDARVRETLLKLDDGRVAHISLRADSDAELANAVKTAEALRFDQTRLSSN